MRKILITGFNGNVGRRIFSSENKLPYNCIFLSKSITGYVSCNYNSYVKCDITKEEEVDPKLWGANEVFHMAGSTHEINSKNYYINNFEATKRLIDKSEVNGVKRFIYISTQAIGEKGGAYSHSKELAENYLMQSKLVWTIIRPSDIYDIENKDSISSLCKIIAYSKFFPIIGDGKYKINPVHVEDFVQFTLKLLKCNSTKSNFKIYNIAGPSPISFLDFCKIRYKEIGKKPIIFHVPILICKWMSSFISSMGFSRIVPDQIERLIMKKDNNIELASRDYQFSPRNFSLK